MNNLAQKICELDCPFGLPTGHRIADHPAPQAPGGEATARPQIADRIIRFLPFHGEAITGKSCKANAPDILEVLNKHINAYDTLAAKVVELEALLRTIRHCQNMTCANCKSSIDAALGESK